MLDVEFLISDKHAIRQNIFYLYKDKVLKNELFSFFKEYFAEHNLVLKEVDYESYLLSLQESSLFDSFAILIDINKLLQLKEGKSLLILSLKKIYSKSYPHRYFFIFDFESKEYEEISKLLEYSELSKISTNIEEVVLTKSTFSKIFAYLITDKTLYDYSKLTNLDLFKASMEEYVLNSNFSFLDFRNKFEFYSSICINFKENYFDSILFRNLLPAKGDKEYFGLHILIGDFLYGPHKKDKVIKEIDRLINKESLPVKVILSNLFKILRDFQIFNIKMNLSKKYPSEFTSFKITKLSKYGSISVANLLKFQNLLCSFEPNLNLNNFILCFEDLLVKFTE